MTDKPEVPRTPVMTAAERDAYLKDTVYDPTRPPGGLFGSLFAAPMRDDVKADVNATLDAEQQAECDADQLDMEYLRSMEH